MSYTYEYPRPSVTTDCVVLTREVQPKVLLIQRRWEPFEGCRAIPGGFLDMDETTEQCARRELREETGLLLEDLRQVGAYSRVDRDPRGRTISVAYLAVVDSPLPVEGLDDAARAEWFPIDQLPPLAFDHEEIMNDSLALYHRMMTEVHD